MSSPPSIFYDQPAQTLASDLIGALLTVDGIGGRIVETEAYAQDDPASHSFAGPTARNASMFGPAGRAYVYRIYGLHDCLNVVAARGEAVLIRALEPLFGVEAMEARRGTRALRDLCAGPGRLSQALGVTRALDGASLAQPPFRLEPRGQACEIASGPRIGIAKAREAPLRFGLRGSPFLSKPLR